MIGLKLITNERYEQIGKHGYDESFIKANPKYYDDCEMAQVASLLISIQGDMAFHESDLEMIPESWDDDEENRKMLLKPYRERLIIAGALIAAELDRLFCNGDK